MCARHAGCLHGWAQLCLRPCGTRLPRSAPRAGEEGAALAASLGAALHSLGMSVRCSPLPQSFFQGLPPAQIVAQGGFSSSREQQSCPAIHLCTQHPLQEMFLPRAAQVPGWLHPCVPGHPSWRSVLITFIHCNQGKESIDSLSSHFCQFFRRHH